MIAAAANAIPQASCTVENVVYYGSKNLLIAWNVVDYTLEIKGSADGIITAVSTHQNGSLLVGSDKGSVYEYKSGKLTLIQNISRSITSLYTDIASDTWAAGSMDGKVHIFNLSTPEQLDTIEFKGYALCIAIFGPLVITGGTSSQISVYHRHLKQTIYLTGHESWVRSLSAKQIDDANFILASASQERYIRLWKFSIDEQKSESLFSTSQKLGEWSIRFEALLMGHDDWVVSVSWDPYGSGNLLSSSADSSLIIWESETDGELWTPSQRLGDLSAWGASTATGTSGGFWSGLWLPGSVTTATRTGSWRSWKRDSWEPVPGPTGHFREVTDVSWFNENFLLTCSLDQTTRLWFVGGDQKENSALREIGRPQIHGYDMITISAIDESMFVSAGDEKVMRVFQLPRQVAEQITELTSKNGKIDQSSLPQVAGVPALGLSNKPESDAPMDPLPSWPREDHLQRLSLWPEVDKLYGHGFEINTLAVSLEEKSVISCCRANNEQHAKLRFYSMETWHEVSPPVQGHSLTVTSLKVSPDGKHVLSVGRDRKFMIVNIATHEVVLDTPKAHTRIIWDGSWCNNTEFLTVSRDKFIKKWNIKGEQIESTKLESPVTAVDSKNEIIVAGDEEGTLTFLDSSLQMINQKHLAGRINRISMNSSLIAVATDLIVTVIPISSSNV